VCGWNLGFGARSRGSDSSRSLAGRDTHTAPWFVTPTVSSVTAPVGRSVVRSSRQFAGPSPYRSAAGDGSTSRMHFLLPALVVQLSYGLTTFFFPRVTYVPDRPVACRRLLVDRFGSVHWHSLRVNEFRTRKAATGAANDQTGRRVGRVTTA
jgi:hypothetical protein